MFPLKIAYYNVLPTCYSKPALAKLSQFFLYLCFDND